MARAPKPVDRWLGLIGGFVLPLLLYLFPKTPAIVAASLVLIFASLFHPIWNFWWIEDYLPRRIMGLTILALALVVIGFEVPMEGEKKAANQTKPLEAVMLPTVPITPVPPTKKSVPTPKGILPPDVPIPVAPAAPPTKPETEPEPKPKPEELYPIVLVSGTQVTRDLAAHTILVAFTFANQTNTEVNVHIEVAGALIVNGSESKLNPLEKDIALGPPPNAFQTTMGVAISAEDDQLYTTGNAHIDLIGQASYPDRGNTTIYHFTGTVRVDLNHLDVTETKWESVPNRPN